MIKTSAHIRAALTGAIVIFVGYMLKQPQMVAWLDSHAILSDVITGLGMAYGVFNTYADPVAIPSAKGSS